MADHPWWDGRRARRQLLVAAVLVSVLVGTIALASGALPPLAPRPDGMVSPPDEPADTTEPFRRLHDAGVTGENVTVAVLDPTGFDPAHPALAGRVAATRSFARGESIQNHGVNDHGTAAASVVARTAPGAELVLVSFDTADGFRAAIAWLVRRNVDVIVAPVGFYGKRGDGSSPTARAAARAVRRGVVFVAPAGNLGRGHWRGDFAPSDNGRHEFRSGTRNFLLGENRRVSLWLSWADHASDGSFDLELYRTNGSASRLVARSHPFDADDAPNERIVADIDPRGTYYFVVRGPPYANGTRLEVSSPSHAFQHRRRARSVVAPATARDAVSVGAFDVQTGRVSPFSSAGPVGDDHPGVDVVAPGHHRSAERPDRFVGTSAAAAHVAGTVALILDANPSLSPAATEGVLRTTAQDVGRPGIDPVAGAGLIDPIRAVERARNVTQSSI